MGDLDPSYLRPVVAKAFQESLGFDDIDDDTAFQAYGGTSLQAILICANIAKATGLTIPVPLLLAHPSVNSLVDALAASEADREERGADPSPTDTLSPSRTPLNDTQAGFLARRELDPDGPTMDTRLIWTLSGQVDSTALQEAVEDVHRHHPELAATYHFDVAGPYASYEVLSPPPTLSVLTATSTAEAVDRARDVLRALPLSPETGVNWRIVLCRADTDESVVGVGLSHITFDGYSESVFARHLSQAYGARTVSHRPAALPDRPDPSVVARLRRRRDGKERDEETSRRLRTYLDKVVDLELPPFDAGRRAVAASGEATLLRTTVPIDGVATTARSLGVTVFTVLVGLYARTLRLTLAQDRFGIAVPVARRDDVDLLEVVGCMVDTTCVAASDLVGAEPNPRVDMVLERSGDAVREALEHSTVSYREMATLKGPRRPGASPLCRTMFAYQDTPYPLLSFPGLECELTRVPIDVPPVELTVEMRPLPGGRMTLETMWDAGVIPAATAQAVHEHLLETVESLGGGLPSDVGVSAR